MRINGTDNKAVIGGKEYSKHIALLNRKKLSDEELVRVFLEDEAAFNEIVNRYGDKIYRLALRITRNHSDAEEVLQEVFITLIKKLYTFREESKFSTWLYRVTANASYIHLKAEKKYKSNVSLEDYIAYDGYETKNQFDERSGLGDYVPYDERGSLIGRIKIKDWSSRPNEALLSREGMEIIEKAVNELPVAYRVVFHLRDVEGFSNEEVAKVLGLSVAAVKSRIHRARLFLRDRLSDYFYEWRK
jgi:RNA polymerase sigma factor, sigma-70 family